MKQVSVADAKNTLPALSHEAEREPIEIVRRGKPVAVIVSRATYERLGGKGEDFWAALRSFRERHDLEELGAPGAFAGLRDRAVRGRPVRW